MKSFLIGALSLIGACTLFAEQTYDLKYVWKADKTYHFQQTADFTSKMSVAGAEMQSDIDMNIDLNYATADAEEGVRVTTSFDDLNMKLDMNGAEMMSYNSAKPGENEMLEKSFAPILDLKLSALYSTGGDLIKIEEFKAPPGGQMLGFGKADLEAFFQDYADYFPENPVKVGETWEGEFDIPSGQVAQKSVSVVTRLTLSSIEVIEGKEFAKIEFVAEPSSIPIEQGGVTLKMNIKELKGTIIHDIQEQVTTENITQMKMVMTVPATEQTEDAPLQEIPIEGTAFMKLVEIK